MLTTTFANLPYADPFPPPPYSGNHRSLPASVLYSESFSDHPSGTVTGGVRGGSDYYWNETATVSRPVPVSMQNGLSQMSVEFWLNVPVGSDVGNGTLITMPGFEAREQLELGEDPVRRHSNDFSTTKQGQPLAIVAPRLGRHRRWPVAPIRRHV